MAALQNNVTRSFTIKMQVTMAKNASVFLFLQLISTAHAQIEYDSSIDVALSDPVRFCWRVCSYCFLFPISKRKTFIPTTIVHSLSIPSVLFLQLNIDSIDVSMSSTATNRWLGWGVAADSGNKMADSDIVVGEPQGEVRRYSFTGYSKPPPMASNVDELSNQVLNDPNSGSFMSFTRPLTTSVAGGK